MKSLSRFNGYFSIDHRNSPGTQEVPEGTVLEVDSQQCCHCGRVILLDTDPVNKAQRSYCATCDHYRCSRIGCLACHPYAERLDKIEKYILSGGNDPLVKESILLTGERIV